MKSDVSSWVMDKLYNNGYEDQIVDFALECAGKENIVVSDIPLSPTLMADSGDKVIISPKVYSTYMQFVRRISNPETAQEIPFILVGNKKNIDGVDYIIIEDIIYDMKDALSETRVSADEATFRKLLASEQYSVISIGHTHGNVSEEIKATTLARTIPEELRTKYDIRDTGLNISVADIYQHDFFERMARELAPTKEILQTIIMYNGDMVMINPDGVSKSNDIQTVLQDGSYLIIPTGLSEQYINKQTM